MDISPYITKLITIDPFVALLTQRCVIRWTEEIPTAAVRLLPAGEIELSINPEFFLNQSEAEKVGLIWHEALHLIEDHLTRSYGLDPNTANVTMDESINQIIPSRFLPKRAILPEMFNHERNKNFEHYYNLLKGKNLSKLQQKKPYKGGLNDEKEKESLKKQIEKSLDKILNKEKQIQDLLDQKEKASKDSSKSKDQSEKRSSLKKNQDDNQDTQEEISERLSEIKEKNSLEKSDEISDLSKENYDKMNDMGDMGDIEEDPDIKSAQDEVSGLQDQIQEALDKIEEISKGQKNRQKERNQEKGSKGTRDGSSAGSSGSEDDPDYGDYEVMDSHDAWHDTPASLDEQKMTLGSILAEVKEETIRKYGSGMVPASLEGTLARLNQKEKVKWSEVLRRYQGTVLSDTFEETRKRPNRKFGILLPGKKIAHGPKIMIAVDISGSMSDREYELSIIEIIGVSKGFLDRIEVVFFADGIFERRALIDETTRKLPSRPGYGGTNFQPIIDLAEVEKPDLIIFLTDGCAPTPRRPKIPVVWCIFGGRDNPDLFGKRILVDLEGNASKTVSEG